MDEEQELILLDEENKVDILDQFTLFRDNTYIYGTVTSKSRYRSHRFEPQVYKDDIYSHTCFVTSVQLNKQAKTVCILEWKQSM